MPAEYENIWTNPQFSGKQTKEQVGFSLGGYPKKNTIPNGEAQPGSVEVAEVTPKKGTFRTI